MTPHVRRTTAARSVPSLSLAPILTLAIALVLVSCAPENSQTFDQVPPTNPPASQSNAAFCDSYLNVLSAFLASPITGGPEGMPDKSTTIAEAQKLVVAMKDLKSKAPAELAPVVEKLVAELDGVATSGDATAMMENMEAIGLETDTWTYDHCGWNQVPITAKDFAFEGLPATLAAGKTGFKMNNTATAEDHVLLITRRKPGVTRSVTEILADGNDPMVKDVDLVAATGAGPMKLGYAAVDLTPGEYIYLCPIPQGGKPEGKTHYALGMFGEFTVK